MAHEPGITTTPNTISGRLDVNHTPATTTKSSHHNWAKLKRAVSHGTSDFFGISTSCDPVRDFSLRRLRLTSRRCGELKDQAACHVTRGDATDPGSPGRLRSPPWIAMTDAIDYGESEAKPSKERSTVPPGTKRAHSSKSHRERATLMRARIVPHSVRNLSSSTSASRNDDRRELVARLSKRESVAGMAWNEFLRRFRAANLTGTRDSGSESGHVGPGQKSGSLYRSRSFAPGSLRRQGSSHVDGKTTGTYEFGKRISDGENGTRGDDIYNLSDDDVFFDILHRVPETVTLPFDSTNNRSNNVSPPANGHHRPFTKFGMLRDSEEEGKAGGGAAIGLTRIKRRVMDHLFERNAERNKRMIGQGVVMDLLNDPGYVDNIWNDPATLDRIERLRDYRPYFTYWVTCVQIVVLVCSMAIYGVGPLGIGLRQQERILLKPSLSLERAGFLEPENFWIGPNAFSLIHLGAKYGPCMRADPIVGRELRAQRDIERATACCIRNDGGGCVQAAREDCSDDLFFSWHSGTVCGQDPYTCTNPLSTVLRPWPSDITEWPVCKSRAKTPGSSLSLSLSYSPVHVTCDLIGRPCCIGIRGSCIITTQEYCAFVRGHFHEEAALCSQVACMGDVCGMIPFAKSRIPDQIYRLWCSIFLHAGLVHLVISVTFQFVVMRDLEKLTGPVRIGIIYFGSGIGGNLASAVFLPDRADVGPAGAQFGLLACVLVELIQNWQILKAPALACTKLAGLYGLLLLLGLLPWIDNYAHVFGFVFGFLLAFALLPYLTFGHFDRRRKLATLVTAVAVVVVLGATLLTLFYAFPDLAYNCKLCRYFDCLPLDPTFCHNYEIIINR